MRALPLVDKWPFWTGDEAYPSPTMGYFYDKAIRHVTPGPYLWPQGTSGPKPMQDCNELLMRCSPFSPEVPDSHPGRLHAAVPVADNAWGDDGGLEMLQLVLVEMEAAGVQPAYTQRLSLEGHPRGDPSDPTSAAVAEGVGPAVLMARDPSGDEFVTPTSSYVAQERGPPASAQRVDSLGEVSSPPDPPQGGATDSPVCVGHEPPDPRFQACPTDESPSIASIVDPTGVLTPHSPAPNPACPTPAVSDGGVASSLEESPIPLAQKPKEPAAVDCSPSTTGTVATVKACSLSSADSGPTPVEHPSSLATVKACSQSSADSGSTPVEHPS